MTQHLTRAREQKMGQRLGILLLLVVVGSWWGRELVVGESLSE